MDLDVFPGRSAGGSLESTAPYFLRYLDRFSSPLARASSFDAPARRGEPALSRCCGPAAANAGVEDADRPGRKKAEQLDYILKVSPALVIGIRCSQKVGAKFFAGQVSFA